MHRLMLMRLHSVRQQPGAMVPRGLTCNPSQGRWTRTKPGRPGPPSNSLHTTSVAVSMITSVYR